MYRCIDVCTHTYMHVHTHVCVCRIHMGTYMNVYIVIWSGTLYRYMLHVEEVCGALIHCVTP
jgi:hypothetical protein